MVTRAPPERPGSFLPLNTREGVAHWPTAPGLRCTLWAPWPAGWPLKPWRFMTPENPRPFDTAVTSTFSPEDHRSAPICWPTAYSLTSSRRSSRTLRPGGTPAPSKWPASGRVSRDGSRTPKVTWMAL